MRRRSDAPQSFVPVFGSDQAAVERIVGWFGELAEQYDAVLFQQSLEDLSRVESGAELFHWAALALPKFHNSPHHPEVLAQLQAKSKELLRHGSPTSRRSRQVPRGDSE